MRIYFILFLLGITVSSPAFAQSEILQLLKKHKVSSKKIGVFIGNPKAPFFKLNENKKFVPASISKILTATSSIEHFPVGHRFKTQLLSNKKISNAKLEGALYFKGGGDPSLVSENLWVLVNNLKRTGVQKIKGPIYIDNSLYDGEHFDQSRGQKRVDRAYDSPTSATPFNWNAVNIFVAPSQKGKPPKVYLDPNNRFFKLVNKAKTVGGSVTRVSAKVIKHKDSYRITVRGAIGVRAKEKAIFKSVPKPEQWAGLSLIEFLKQRDIEVENKKILEQKTPTKASLLAEVEGWDVETLYSGLLRFSNNFIAEMLTKNIAVSKGQKGSIEKGVAQIRQDLKKYGVSNKDFSFVSPSGLSRENKITPIGFNKILAGVQKNFEVYPVLVSSLPTPGTEGSLSSRLKKLKNPKWIRAKTGQLSGVVTFAGFVQTQNNGVVPFTMMYNGPKPAWKIHGLFDDIIYHTVEKY